MEKSENNLILAYFRWYFVGRETVLHRWLTILHTLNVLCFRLPKKLLLSQTALEDRYSAFLRSKRWAGLLPIKRDPSSLRSGFLPNNASHCVQASIWAHLHHSCWTEGQGELTQICWYSFCLSLWSSHLYLLPAFVKTLTKRLLSL